MELLPTSPTSQLVTRTDMHAFGTELRGEMGELRGEINTKLAKVTSTRSQETRTSALNRSLISSTTCSNRNTSSIDTRTTAYLPSGASSIATKE